MKKLISLFTLAAAVFPAASAQQTCCNTNDYSAYYKDLPIELNVVTPPQIPDYSVSITDFGGVSDGITLNTEAFARAMAHLEEKGGGHLIVPEGFWYTGPITFVDNVDLHAERGAFILFSENLNDYPLVSSSYEGLMVERCLAPLNAVGRKNISITGKGIFNGNGQKWRAVKRSKTTENQWDALVKSGGVVGNKGNTWYPNERIAYGNMHGNQMTPEFIADPDSLRAIIHDFSRPNMVVFRECQNVMFKGVTFENSPAWNVHPLMCRNLIIDGVNIRNPWFAQNGDGIDVESCTDVLLVNTTFDVGDDAICLKSGKDKPGRDRGIPTSNMLVDGCTVYHGHGGFVIGSEMSGGVKDVVCRNCVFDGTDVGLRFKSGRGRGGVVENIWIDGISMYNIEGNALIFNLYYGGKAPLDVDGNVIDENSDKIPAVNEGTPAFRNITIDNVVCRGARRVGQFNGIPEMPVQNVVVRNSVFKAAAGLELNYVNGLTLDNVTIDAPGDALTEGRGVENLSVK